MDQEVLPTISLTTRHESPFTRHARHGSGQIGSIHQGGTHPSHSSLFAVHYVINTPAAGGDQRPHRHDGAAVTLVIAEEGSHAMIDGQRVNWSTGAAQITPAARLHARHNRGPCRMRAFVIRNEGLHFYTRTVGFSFH